MRQITKDRVVRSRALHTTNETCALLVKMLEPTKMFHLGPDDYQFRSWSILLQ